MPPSGLWIDGGRIRLSGRDETFPYDCRADPLLPDTGSRTLASLPGATAPGEAVARSQKWSEEVPGFVTGTALQPERSSGMRSRRACTITRWGPGNSTFSLFNASRMARFTSDFTRSWSLFGSVSQ